MKKLLLFLLLSSFAFGQYVSPYYPTQQTNAVRGFEATQLTYYDTSYVQSVIPAFLSNNLGMTQINTDLDRKTHILTQVYQDKFSSGKLIFQMSTSVINSDVILPEIVTSIKVTGSPDRVISFFVRFWDTTLDFTNIKSDVERKHMQDVARFYFNKGKPYINVINNTYKSAKEFETFFNELLEKEKAK